MTDAADRLWVGAMPAAYDKWLAPAMFQPYAVELAQRAARLDPAFVLELAAGTGVLTRALVDAMPDASITATDLNPAMVEFGSTAAPSAHWQEADALELPFGDDQFELVVCQFGVMFFPDKARAFAEAHRVLGGAGHVLFSVWDPVETHEFAAALVAALDRALPDDPPRFVVDIPHGYFDVDAIAADLGAGGLELVSSEQVRVEGHARAAADIANGFCTGTPLRAAIEARGDLAVVTDVVAEELQARLGPGPVAGRMSARFIEARPVSPGR